MYVEENNHLKVKSCALAEDTPSINYNGHLGIVKQNANYRCNKETNGAEEETLFQNMLAVWK